MNSHSATTTLGDIIDELRLKYDSSVGLLDGAAIRKIPNLNTLHNLSKLLAKLAKNLQEIERKDNILLERLNKLKNSADGGDDISESSDARKRENDDNEEDESIPLAKRRKKDTIKSEIEDLDKAPAPSKNSSSGNLEEVVGSVGVVGGEDEEADEKGKVNSKDDPIPPVQTGSFTPSNDTRLKNPKSEFVTSQTLSAETIAELGLFSETNHGLETQGKDYLKRKYGVASYPENDLKDMLPGEIPDMDFSKSKAPSNQVQFSTYQSYIESYFRPFSNDDIKFCNEKFVIPPGFEKRDYDPTTTPYLIPKLGPFYADVWAEEDAALRSKLSSPAAPRPPLEAYKAKGDFENLNDDKLLTEDISCGPLSSRLLSAVLSVHEAKDKIQDEGEEKMADTEQSDIKKEEADGEENLLAEDSATQLDSGETFKVTSEVSDYFSMEERLKRELKYIGIFMNLQNDDEGKPKKPGNIIDTDDWILNREDDEICSEIRELQDELKGAVIRNRQRKKYLIPILEEQLAYQEYCTILEDLDKQVDQAYMKRLKAKSKKKKTPEVTNTAQQQAANSGLKALLDKRSRWINSIGKLFPPAHIMKRIPKESIFKDNVVSEEKEAEEEVDVVNDEET
ncbi:putative chromatin-remodeling complexes subunit [Clavispora lusitaniae]|uniref:Chromatin-remodeling complexes subunit n=2 Tax=Clavispora lusitaniae TaxID=36911 RepID=A0ACD0WM99_CLALS|nr:Transcriptional regulator [Clavispora lusitaniae]OVF11112.1 putative histone acetyltransferase [Clavispora lusitaniae]QFZ28351.1 putative chromatin-remodeling complexes subunit [Clavispora lusitaniae]QFZ34014.1 putative chromatin-remodeling complexes subunit [Clavispora lusitaniae]QFZ39698.1 putative chromatin-remodeling complexes subunit [Clavispora lusitaniae]